MEDFGGSSRGGTGCWARLLLRGRRRKSTSGMGRAGNYPPLMGNNRGALVTTRWWCDAHYWRSRHTLRDPLGVGSGHVPDGPRREGSGLRGSGNGPLLNCGSAWAFSLWVRTGDGDALGGGGDVDVVDNGGPVQDWPMGPSPFLDDVIHSSC